MRKEVNKTDLVTLEAGKKYYIYFAFKKYTSDTPTDTYRENMRVKIDGLEIVINLTKFGL